MVTRIVSGWSQQPAGRPKRPAGFTVHFLGAIAAATLLQPLAAYAATGGQTSVEAERAASPQWTGAGGERAALRLIELLQTSELDGLEPAQFKPKQLLRALRAAERGNMAASAKANAMLDRALISYVTALRSAPKSDWIINDREAVPTVPSPKDLLAQAAAAPSLDEWVDAMPFMHHSYAELRRALGRAEGGSDRESAELLRLNLERARFLPASGRYVLVNSAAQRLYMYDNGRPVDWMRVVVGKPVNPTPTMAAMIRFTAVNPYWNVPPDLAAERIAPNVLKQGIGYLKRHGYVVFSDWSENPATVDPSTIDWQAVADGKIQIRVRQNPGPGNAMGRMKFMFPNPQGVYLHDTPDKELLNEAARLFSGGCVRLEDAPRLAQWLYRKPLIIKSGKPEQPIELTEPVPVYLAYLTAVPSGSEIVHYEDIYGKDRSQLASANRGKVAAR